MAEMGKKIFQVKKFNERLTHVYTCNNNFVISFVNGVILCSVNMQLSAKTIL